MTRIELCVWLRSNSSGIYRPAAEAADEIELLASELNRVKNQHKNAVMRLEAAHADLLRYDPDYPPFDMDARIAELRLSRERK